MTVIKADLENALHTLPIDLKLAVRAVHTVRDRWAFCPRKGALQTYLRHMRHSRQDAHEF